ncbi:MAG: hypothetical protein HC836_46870 [Richelia sp. RM2_1_2]|nr:hypothetical protein [Richelia sp. RM2_1_2]
MRSDGGPEFSGKIISELKDLLSISHLIIVPYHPQANGLVERRNAEVMKHLRILVLNRRVSDAWSSYLPLVQRILNYTHDLSIGTYPAKIIFGDMIPDISFDIVSSYDGVVVSDYLVNLQQVQSELIHATQSYLSTATTAKDAKLVDLEPIQFGEYVLLSYPSKPPNKLASLYRGPLQVVDKRGNNLYRLLDLISNKVIQVHISRMKKFNYYPTLSSDKVVEIAASDSNEYIVEAIMDHRYNGKKKIKSNIEFLVRWQGYEQAYDTWEPYANLKMLFLWMNTLNNTQN